MRRKKEKENSWSLYKECSRILQENHKKWKERKVEEDRRRIEMKKADRLAIGAKKKSEAMKKKKKETKIKGTADDEV